MIGIEFKHSMKRLLPVFITILLLLCTLAPLVAQSQAEHLNILMDPGKDEIILNPYTASDSNSIVIMQNLYDGLFEYDWQTSEAIPCLAESYSVSEDGLLWTFHLRNARFSDGSRITSETFAESWNYMKDGPLAGNISFIARLDDGSLDLGTPDSSTLTVRLTCPVPYLPSLLCQTCLAAIKDTTSYSGAYTLLGQDSQQIRLRRNPYYWDKVETDFVDILLGDSLGQMLLDGTAQWSMAAVDEASDYMIVSRLYATTFFYFSAKDGAYADENIRKALIAAVPWDIIRILQGSFMDSKSLVPDSGLEADISTEITRYLEEGGYPYGQRYLPMINMAVTRGAQNATVAEFIATRWSGVLGITVALNTVPVTLFASVPEENPYDFCTITWIADYLDPMAFLQMFRSDSSYNLANYSDSAFDALLDEAAAASDAQSRTALLLQAEQILLDSGVVIPMSTAFATNFVRKDLISGWETNPLDIHPFKKISLVSH